MEKINHLQDDNSDESGDDRRRHYLRPVGLRATTSRVLFYTPIRPVFIRACYDDEFHSISHVKIFVSSVKQAVVQSRIMTSCISK